jgi:hypothetical protein
MGANLPWFDQKPADPSLIDFHSCSFVNGAAQNFRRAGRHQKDKNAFFGPGSLTFLLKRPCQNGVDMSNECFNLVFET